jgi:UDP-N-acetylmuramoyl-L-alanyl-D-glutamate--2,6-diaminopimelate ligase
MIQLHTPAEAVNWLNAKVTGELQIDSRNIQPGDGFIAWPGAAVDGRQFVKTALQKGAAACLVEYFGSNTQELAGIVEQDKIASYSGLKNAIGLIASKTMNMPTMSLNIIAITGTNGKTTTAWWLSQALQAVSAIKPTAQTKCFMVGTLGIGVPNAVESTGLTTPDPILLHKKFREYVDNGFSYCAIEASSIGIEEHRLDGTDIKVAIFTNFTQDHLDYHGSMQAYWDAKLKLFQWPTLKVAIINIDDAKGKELAKVLSDNLTNTTHNKKLDIWTIAIHQAARIKAFDIKYTKNGLQFNIQENDEIYLVETKFFGEYNVSNMLGVVAAMRASGIDLQTCIEACKALTAVPGRMDVIALEYQPLVVVDYAHTPDALKQALIALRPAANTRGGKLICVFGCGGNRDASKRPLMAKMAQAHADAAIVTADNSRLEKTEKILSNIVAGFTSQVNVVVEVNRAIAIAMAIKNAHQNDVILIAGKGHENYQDDQGIKTYFSDKEQALHALKEMSVVGGFTV